MKPKILALITTQEGSKRIIEKAAEIARSYYGELHILHVFKENALNVDNTKILAELFEHGREAGGSTHGIVGEDIPRTILDFIKKTQITHVVAGMPRMFSPYKSIGIAEIITKEMPHIEIILLPPDEKFNPYDPHI